MIPAERTTLPSMNASLRSFVLAIALVASGCAIVVPQPSFDRIVVFGDSNVDNGNLLRLTNGRAPALPNWKGRNSNGPNVAEYLAERLAVKHDNFAASGAYAGEGNLVARLVPDLAPIVASTGVFGQIDEFAKAGKPLGERDVVILWAGSNDIFGVRRAQPDLLQRQIAEATRNIETALDRLVALGAQRIVVATRTPREVLENENDLNGIDLNRAIIAAVQRAAARNRAKIEVFDAYASIRDMMANPSRYGFMEVKALCVQVPACVSERYENGLKIADGYVNWDAAHKTTRVHWLMAEQMQRMLRP